MRLKIDIEKLNVDGGYIDVGRWFNRYELYFDYQIDDGDKTEEGVTVDRSAVYLKYLPLYLSGSALLCFEELPAHERGNYTVVKARLSDFHRLDRSTAYANFITSTYTGNGVDLFVAELRRYLGVLDLSDKNADVLILEQFMRSIPPSSAAELRSRCTRDTQIMELNTVITVARHLPSLQVESLIGAFHPGRRHGKGKGKGRQPPPHIPSTQPPEQPAKAQPCFVCEGTDHKMATCPVLIKLRVQGNATGPAYAASTLGPNTKAAQPSFSRSH
jgi:hypothetical protein